MGDDHWIELPMKFAVSRLNRAAGQPGRASPELTTAHAGASYVAGLQSLVEG